MEKNRQEMAKSGVTAVETYGFQNEDLVKIKAPNLRSAAFQLGENSKKIVGTLLTKLKAEEGLGEILRQAANSLKNLRGLAKDKAEAFTTKDGINRLERYIQSLEGFCEGAGITYDEGAFLQMANQTGCETLTVQNTKTGEVAAIHAEEDSGTYNRFGSAAWGKRWVEMQIGERNIQFCSYAGDCGFGDASGLVTERDKSYFQAADTISAANNGSLWSNAVAFMALDCANINKLEELVAKIKNLPKPIFYGGYALQMVEAGRPPKIAAIEFAGNTIEFIPGKMSGSRKIQVGTNYPQHPDIKQISYYGYPKSQNETSEEYDKRLELSRITKRRQSRLAKLGSLVGKIVGGDDGNWGEDNVLNTAYAVYLNAGGDWFDGSFFGLSNEQVAMNDILYVAPDGKMKLIVRKGF